MEKTSLRFKSESSKSLISQEELFGAEEEQSFIGVKDVSEFSCLEKKIVQTYTQKFSSYLTTWVFCFRGR